MRIVVCQKKRGDNTPQVLAVAKKFSRGLRRGYVVNFNEAVDGFREVLAEAEKTINSKIRRAILAVGGVGLESKIVEGNVVVMRADSEFTASDIQRAIEISEKNLPDASNRHVLHRIPVGYKIDGKKVLGRPEGMKGNKLEARVLYITSLKQHLNDLIKVVEEAGVGVEDIVASPVAASLVSLDKVQKNAGCVLINVGSQTTSMIVYEENLPVHLQVFPIGSTDITNDIALGFRVPLDEAERIKKGEIESPSSKRKLDEIIEARLSDIFELMENSLKKIGRNGLLPAGVIITGGGAAVSEIDEMAKSYFKLPAKVANTTPIGPKNKSLDSSWSVAYGLCLIGCSNTVVEDIEEQTGTKLIKETRKNFLRWLKEFWP